MRRLCRSVTEVALLAALAWGCGSNAGDSLVMRFVRFDSTGLTQADAVRESSADVDVVPGACASSGGTSGSTVTSEFFTQTIINAVFVNEEGADIHLQRYRVYLPQTINGQQTGLPTFVEQALGTNLPGGRCANVNRHCALDQDCTVLGIAGNCVHSETTVSALVLFDFTTKSQLDRPEFTLVPMATDVAVQFFGTDDADQSFEVSTGYVATFGNFDNCASGSEVDG